jgi:multiple sugar transport system permease protein
MRHARFILIALYLAVAAAPLVWMGMTSLKTKSDATSLHVKYLPTGNASVPDDSPRFTATFDAWKRLGQASGFSKQSFLDYLLNSVIIAVSSTAASVALATTCAYGFSRFRIAGAQDWLFFILSTRFLPPLAVVVPLLLMWRTLSLTNTHVGLIVLYTAFNLSLAVWLMKGFIDDIPRAFEEAALVDGYTRLAAFWKVTLPQARTGMAVTAVFCLISAWNEYAFALTLNNQDRAKTVPVYFAGLQGTTSGIDWPQVAAGSLLFVVPVVVFVVLVRKHLLRGVTFGTVKG